LVFALTKHAVTLNQRAVWRVNVRLWQFLAAAWGWCGRPG